MNIEQIYFPNIGYSYISFTEEELLPIKNEINKIQKKNFNGIQYNSQLAGNIEKQFKLVESKNYAQNLILPIAIKFDEQFNYLKTINILTKNCPLILDSLWVNFQKKHEFNPYHLHSGLFSFVIWIQNPYDIKDEMARPASKESNNNCPGHFEFMLTNSLGRLQPHKIPADKNFENSGVLFPSSLAHCVYPFFTSDDYRISVSGNIKVEVDLN
jgi:hypothetical protein